MSGKSLAFKAELLLQRGIQFEAVPRWQRYETGIYWEEYEKAGYDPHRNLETITTRHRVKIDKDLPVKDEYGAFIGHLLAAQAVDV
ncbi:hypothetical protein [Ktedonobacter robiniae]|uniref:hypothetical protein n=1 Tax=Ktedonobacter robiniae TaxID=2778365 RepID=UPI0019156DEF|nr:hypothetical protein [Ktedonobacter robiniae]